MELLDEEDAKVILEDYDEDLQSDGTLISGITVIG